jgi:nucleotide-binding universal stress UspA family protein
MNEALRIAQGGVDALRTSGLNARIRVREGTPGSGIVEEALEWPADLIVMGSRGQGAIKRLMLGSVAHYVLEHAPCSVEIARSRESP